MHVETDQLVLFGPPGVGKSSVGRMLEARGYYYFDGDAHSLPEGVALNHQGRGMTPELRDRDYAHIINQFLDCASIHPLIVMDYHFMFDRYRLDLNRLNPNLRWVYLVAPFQDMMARFDRPGHLLKDIDFIRRVSEMFEEPSFPVTRIDALLPIDEVAKRVLNF